MYYDFIFKSIPLSKLQQIFKRRASEKQKDFHDLIPGSSDEELIRILKQRTYFIPEAAQLAVEEAIKRGIIHSEEDLLHEDYRVKELRFSWFPEPANDKIRLRLIKSLGRSLVFCGIFPLVYGLIKMNAGHQFEGALLALFALIWMSLASQLTRTFHKQIVFVMLAANAIGASYVFIRLISFNQSPLMDLFVAVVLFALITYALIYIYTIRNRV